MNPSANWVGGRFFMGFVAFLMLLIIACIYFGTKTKVEVSIAWDVHTGKELVKTCTCNYSAQTLAECPALCIAEIRHEPSCKDGERWQWNTDKEYLLLNDPDYPSYLAIYVCQPTLLEE